MSDYKSETRASYVDKMKDPLDVLYNKFTSSNCPNSELIKKHHLAVWHSGGGFFHLARICSDEKIYLINPIESDPNVDCTWLNDMTDEDIKAFNKDSLCQFGHENREGDYEYFVLPFEEGLKRMEDEIFEHAVHECQQMFWGELVKHYPHTTDGSFDPLESLKWDEACEKAIKHWLDCNHYQ